MTQLGADDLCKCSFGVDNVVFLIIRIIAGNSDIVNMHRCSKSKIYFVYAKLMCLLPIGSKSVTVVECVNHRPI